MFSTLAKLAKQTITDTYHSKSPADTKYLDWRNRPALLQLKILTSWLSVKYRFGSDWDFNGKDEAPYNIGGVNEYELVKDHILKCPEKNEFYILDIGAGNFGFGRGLCKFLNEINDITSRNISITIISIRGENYSGEQKSRIGVCTLVELGSFQIENLIEQFHDKKLNLLKKVNFIFSHKCFKHLADSVGTIVQAIDMLSPQGGILYFDADIDYILNDNRFFVDHTKKAKYLCKIFTDDMKAEYKVEKGGNIKGIFIKRTTEVPCQLPLKYSGYEKSFEDEGINYSGLLTKFEFS